MMRKGLVLSKLFLLMIGSVCGIKIYAAELVDLSFQNASILQSYQQATDRSLKYIQFDELNRTLDPQGTLHVRMQENYQGYAVWGGDIIAHIPSGANIPKEIPSILNAAKTRGSLNGTLYKNIDADLSVTPHYIFNSSQSKKAINHAVVYFQDKRGEKVKLSDKQSNLIVYIDNNNKAHWAYKVAFYVNSTTNANRLPEKPIFIIDAVSMEIYQQWNDIKTIEENVTLGGGFGGNQQNGWLIYDGLKNHLPQLTLIREGTNKMCYMKNNDVIVRNYIGKQIPDYFCNEINKKHNNVYWNDDFNDAANNDALFGGTSVKDLYQKWYGIPILADKNGNPMKLIMEVHAPINNAYWDGNKMVLGNGVLHSQTTFNLIAHEVTHGFTGQNARLVYFEQPGGINESFSDMAGQAIESFIYGKNSWQNGVRYMDKPSKDCNGRTPGDGCSIDDANQYRNGLDVHFSCGVFNRFFYLLATSKDWNVMKAFRVMLHANRYYWTPNTNFKMGACGVIKAARDWGYSTDDIIASAKKVKLQTDGC